MIQNCLNDIKELRTSINKWNHFDQKSCWENLSQQQQTSRLQCEKLRTHEQRRQKSSNTIFFHIYRRHIYCFVIINKMKIIDQMMNEIDIIEQILNSVLNLFVHRLVVEQKIYDLSTLTSDFFYFISTSHELDWQKKRIQYLLKCDWSVAYFWIHDWKRFSHNCSRWRFHKNIDYSIQSSYDFSRFLSSQVHLWKVFTILFLLTM